MIVIVQYDKNLTWGNCQTSLFDWNLTLLGKLQYSVYMVTGKSFSNLDSSSLAYHVDMYYWPITHTGSLVNWNGQEYGNCKELKI